MSDAHSFPHSSTSTHISRPVHKPGPQDDARSLKAVRHGLVCEALATKIAALGVKEKDRGSVSQGVVDFICTSTDTHEERRKRESI